MSIKYNGKDYEETYGKEGVIILKPVEEINAKEGQRFWFITTGGKIKEAKWEANTPYYRQLKNAWLYGNAFTNQEEAIIERERRKIHQELKDFAESHNSNLDWNNLDQPKFYLAYCSDLIAGNLGKLDMEYRETYEHWEPYTVYFSDLPLLVKAINFIGKQRLLKYYFGGKK